MQIKKACSRFGGAYLVILGCLVGCATGSNSIQQSESFSFGLWGDMPYKKNGDDRRLPDVLRSINQSDIAFSIFDGDIKDGSSKCTDDVYTDALAVFSKMEKPVVYVPGDNEWTDCHRLNNGGYDALERLSHLRKVMFPTPHVLGKQSMQVTRQGASAGAPYVENVRFSHGPIVFVGLNVPGSNNNLIVSSKDCKQKSARSATQCDASNAEFLARDEANIVWLTQTFEMAKNQRSLGVVVVIQGDPGFDLPETEDVDESQQIEFSGYRNFMNHLAQLSSNFNGQVLFVHGDTHFFKIDKPLYSPSRLLTNFTRVQTFGSPHLHWVKVRVNPGSAHLFEIEPVIVK